MEQIEEVNKMLWPELIRAIVLFVSLVNIFLLLILFNIFWSNHRELKTKFSSGLLIFTMVYMLKRLQLDLSVIIAFTVLSQLMNLAFLRIWGRF